MKIGQVDVGATAKATWKDFREDDVQGLAAEVAYNFLFAVVPLLVFLTALSGFVSRAVGVNDAMGSITDWLFKNLPATTATAVVEPIRDVIQNQSGGFLSLGALLALWSGKNAIAAMMKALNVAFDVKETRPWWKKTGIAMGLTVLLGVAVVAVSSFFLAGSFVGEELAGVVGLGDTFVTIWSVLRWPLILAVVMAAVAFFYWAGPNVTAPFTWLTPGSVLAVVLWGVATLGLGLYFQFFGSYAVAYGALGGVLAFVFWLYLMSLILLIGGEINAVVALALSPEIRAQVADPAKAGDGASTRRRKAAGGEAPAGSVAGVLPSPAPRADPAPSAALGSAVPWPSAEREARVAFDAEGSAGHRRRFRRAVATLGVSAAAAVSGALLGADRRDR